ncbi:MAG: hypothetical protein WB795_12300 [Candidatus Acidiferrales bacterium]
MTFYKRNLGHWHPDGAAVVLTWHLAGALPKDLLKSVTMQQASGLKISAGKKFVILDRAIDGAAVGPTIVGELGSQVREDLSEIGGQRLGC